MNWKSTTGYRRIAFSNQKGSGFYYTVQPTGNDPNLYSLVLTGWGGTVTLEPGAQKEFVYAAAERFDASTLIAACVKLWELHVLIQDDRDDSAEGEALRDAMDPLLDAMIKEDRDKMADYSEQLYRWHAQQKRGNK